MYQAIGPIISINCPTLIPTISNVLVNVDYRTYKAVEQLVQGTWLRKFAGQGKDSKGLSHSHIQVKKVQRIENPTAYQLYRAGMDLACRAGIRSDFRHIRGISGESEVLTATLKIPELEEIRLQEVNEYFLFHGTKGWDKGAYCLTRNWL